MSVPLGQLGLRSSSSQYSARASQYLVQHAASPCPGRKLKGKGSAEENGSMMIWEDKGGPTIKAHAKTASRLVCLS